jgi:glutamate/tyrosine decarboxylase-like PLP-dependent enzyme
VIHVDFDPALLRALAHARTFYDGLPERPVAARAAAEHILAALDGPMPGPPTDAVEVIDELARAADPGLTAMPGGRFFGWVIGGALPAAVAADWLTSVWDQNCGSPAGTPAAAAVEQVALRWLAELFDLPRGCSGALVTGAQLANFVGLAAARHRVLHAVGWDLEEDGLAGAPPLSVVVGAERHDTVDRALRFLGVGRRQLVVVDADDAGRMRAERLAAALAGARGPTVVVAQAGNVNGGAVDPLAAIADEVDALRARLPAGAAWLHVDGAFGLWARVSPALAHLVAGAERADSWASDAHKWLNTPYDCGIVFCRDADAHRAAIGTSAAYLPAQSEQAVRTPFDYTPELSRRARGFAVWAALRQLGRTGVVELVERSCALARRLADGLAAAGAEVAAVGLNQVVARFGDDERTREVVRRVLADGTCYPTVTTWKGRAAMRLSVCNFRTDLDDVRRSIDAITRAART